MKATLVHDWLTGMRGGEKCLEVLCEIFPQADLYTLLHVPGSVSKIIEGRKIKTSALQGFPGSARYYRYYLPLFPKLVEGWDTGGEEHDLVFSLSHCVAKGVPFRHARRRVCYCFTPARYLWCQTENYYAGNWKQTALNLFKNRLKKWDLKSNERVDEFIGISDHVCRRIKDFYRRDAVTIYPPVDVDFYQPPSAGAREDFYLMVGALEPYKRVDLALGAFREFQHPLKIVGKGTMLEEWRGKASSNVEFLGWKSDEEIRSLYQRAKGLIFPGEEDFGIVPLEAQACGCPVVAYGVGGVRETVREDETGLFFDRADTASLLDALRRFEGKSWGQAALRMQAERFSRERFAREIRKYLGVE